MKKFILFIDSGIGGLTTLASTITKLRANYIYFADNKFAPYGNKSEQFIQKRLMFVISKFLKQYNINIVVLACNTATTSAIDFLRNKFKTLTIIGTEPAIKVAFDQKFTNPIIIATAQTISKLRQRNSLKSIKLLKIKTLATNIDNFYLFPTHYNKYKLLKDIYYIKLKSKHNDSIVLGCTHYSFFKQKIEKITNLQTFDGNTGVANRIVSLQKNTQQFSTIKIVLSNSNHSLKQKYKKILNQILANQNKLC